MAFLSPDNEVVNACFSPYYTPNPEFSQYTQTHGGYQIDTAVNHCQSPSVENRRLEFKNLLRRLATHKAGFPGPGIGFYPILAITDTRRIRHRDLH
jgi:hypothetical protein